MKQVLFVCRTCEDTIKHIPDHVAVKDYPQTKFESLTEAWQHLMETGNYQDSWAHSIEAVVNETDEA